MKSIGILGSGKVATALATKLANTGYAVTIGSRDVAGAAGRWTGPKVSFGTPAEAAQAALLVVNATPGDTSLERLSALREELKGKVLVDVSNATERGPNGMPGGLLYPNSSLAEHLQEILPETAVVKTLNTMLSTVMVDPSHLSVAPTAFMSGNNSEAKEAVRELLGDLGWQETMIEDIGEINTARGTEAFMLLVPAILRTRGFKPFALTVAR